MTKKIFLLTIIAILFTLPAMAIQPNEVMDNPVQNERARMLNKIIRCLVCPNQTIDESETEFSVDVRKIVRNQIIKGKSDHEILDHLVGIYGDEIIFNPQKSKKNIGLWAGPIFIIFIALLSVIRFLYRRQKQ